MIVPLYELGTGGGGRAKSRIKELKFLKYCEWKPIVCYMPLCEYMIYAMIWFYHNSMNMMIWILDMLWVMECITYDLWFCFDMIWEWTCLWYM